MITINKTADECIVESAMVLFSCFVDSNLEIQKKQEFTKWIALFFDFQDAINNQKETEVLEQKITKVKVPFYYKNALQEFKNANLIYNKVSKLKDLKPLILDYSSKQTNKIVNSFSAVFIKAIKTYTTLENNFIENFKLLIYTIHYHLSYNFKKELEKTVATLIKILRTKVFIKKEIQLINLILDENIIFFSKIQEIQITNFIYKLEELFKESLIQNDQTIEKEINNLIFSKPKKILISMNILLKLNNINFYQEIWRENTIDEKKSKLFMHLFAYETYFLQGHNNHEIYEELVLKNIIDDKKYWNIVQQYKFLNKIK